MPFNIHLEKRDSALDYVKGFLVEIMIIYHVLNYYFNFHLPVLIYIDFVTGSFVFITGYLVSSLYIKKYKDDNIRMFTRLFSRGVKLLLIFLVINFIVYLTALQNYDGYKFKINQFFSNLDSILIWGSAKNAVFELLVPIAYTLILSSVLVLCVKNRYLISLSIIPFLSTSLIYKQDSFFNVYFICIGLAGLVFGYFSKTIHSFSFKKIVMYMSTACIIIYYLVINIWGRNNILIYLFGVTSVLLAVYSFASNISDRNFSFRLFNVFSKYTLICYLAQILFLQLLSRILIGKVTLGLSLLLAFITTNLFLYFLCKLISYLYNSNKFFKQIYSIFFG